MPTAPRGHRAARQPIQPVVACNAHGVRSFRASFLLLLQVITLIRLSQSRDARGYIDRVKVNRATRAARPGARPRAAMNTAHVNFKGIVPDRCPMRMDGLVESIAASLRRGRAEVDCDPRRAVTPAAP